jgi:hypothetical protein
MDKITDGMWIAASIFIVGMTYTIGVAKPYYHADNCAAVITAAKSANSAASFEILDNCLEAGSAALFVKNPSRINPSSF